METLVIGFCGGTGSGKTTLANRIYKKFEDEAILINMDCYYKNHPEMTYDERTRINYDHPNAFDTDLLIADLKALKEGKTIRHPTYDFTRHMRADEWAVVEPKRLIIVEGILLFENKELADMLDIKVYVDTDADVRILRRILRDVKERGRSLDSVVTQYLTTVKPMHERFIEPSKRIADIIVPEGGYNQVCYDMLIGSISKRLNK